MALLYEKQFFPCFVFSRVGLIFSSELQINLFVTDDTLLNRVARLIGASFSKKHEKADNTDIGLQFDCRTVDPFLNIGCNAYNFQLSK